MSRKATKKKRAKERARQQRAMFFFLSLNSDFILRSLTGHGARTGGDDHKADADEGEDGGAGHCSCEVEGVYFEEEERKDKR